MNEITPEMIDEQLRKRLQKERDERNEAINKMADFPSYTCPVCKMTITQEDNQHKECFICNILSNTTKFEPTPWYNRTGDILHWYFENTDSYLKWHPHGGLSTYHALDDDRIIGFQIRNAAGFCSMLYKLIMEK